MSGSQTYGGGPSLSETDTAPGGVTLSGTLACSTGERDVRLRVPQSGIRTVDGSSCSGLSPSDPSYVLYYQGTANSYVVSQELGRHLDLHQCRTQPYGDEGATVFTVTVSTDNGEQLPATESVAVDVGSASCGVSLVPGQGVAAGPARSERTI